MSLPPYFTFEILKLAAKLPPASAHTIVIPKKIKAKGGYSTLRTGAGYAGKALQSKYGPLIALGVLAGAALTPTVIRKLRASKSSDGYYSY